ncbi:MAG: DUF2520 domain-containing protein [Thermoanaerobaculia bacterium]
MSPAHPPLSDLRFSLVGAGAVGQSLAAWIVACGGTLCQVAGRPGSTRLGSFAQRLGLPALDTRELSSRGEALLLVAVPDGALADVAGTLATRPQAAVALHVSGVAAATVLAPLRAAGSAIGGLHPLRAFPAPEAAVEEAVGVFFALDGDPQAILLGRRLAVAFGGSAAVVSAEQRPLYHLVATLMAGAVTTVAAVAAEIAARSGLPAEVRPGFARLATDALAKALALADPAAGITGPAARGDQATLLHELAALERIAPQAVPVVVALARESLRQRARLSAPDPPRQALAGLLADTELLDLTKDRVLTSKPKPAG